jgi:CRP-like cAMP-binding protein
MRQKEFKAGEIIFEEGDSSVCVYRIESGDVEVFVESNGQTVILGVMGAGEFLGEMGMVDDQPRSASARAISDVTASRYEEDEFFQLISQDSSSAERMIIRLCERLRNVTKKYTQEAVLGGKAFIDEATSTNEELGRSLLQNGRKEGGSAEPKLTLFPSSQQLAQLLPEGGIPVRQLPFTVGRLPEGKESESTIHIDLKIPDSMPYRLSRRHFALYQASGGYGILDLGSALGTELNGNFLGRDFGKDFEYLKMGANRITAGGKDSPFTFRVLMEPE